MSEKTSAYWVDIADYDLETARAMLETGRYLYVGFMCHQVIEKGLKAAIAKSEVLPPKSHKLRMLAELAGLYERMNDSQHRFLDLLQPLSVGTRYPNEMRNISSSLSAERCQAILAETREVYEWIKATL